MMPEPQKKQETESVQSVTGAASYPIDSLFFRDPSPKRSVTIQEHCFYCADQEIPGTLTLSTKTRSLYFEPDLSNPLVIAAGLSVYQAYIDLSDIIESGAVSAPPLHDEDEPLHFLQLSLRILERGESRSSSEASSRSKDARYPVVLFRTESRQIAHNFAKPILDFLTRSVSSDLVTLTRVPFFSDDLLIRLHGSPRRPNFEESEEVQDTNIKLPLSPSGSSSDEVGLLPSESSPRSPMPQILAHKNDLAAINFGFEHPDATWLMSPDLLLELRPFLPLPLRFADATLGYCPKVHGTSLGNFYRHLEGVYGTGTTLPTVLLLEDGQGKRFGCFVGHRWRMSLRFYGNGECFVFSLREKDRVETQVLDRRTKSPFDSIDAEAAMSSLEVSPASRASDDSVEITAYHWTGKNELFQFGDERRFLIGGSTTSAGKSAIVINEGWLRGQSGACDTFGSPNLASTEEFLIRQAEVWVLQARE